MKREYLHELHPADHGFEKKDYDYVFIAVPCQYIKDVLSQIKINDKSMTNRNLRFLAFCRYYKVKTIFLHDQGYQKSIKNL